MYVLVTCKNRFNLYSGRLETKMTEELEDPGEFVTAAAFNRDSSLLVVGTKSGKMLSYRIEDGEL